MELVPSTFYCLVVRRVISFHAPPQSQPTIASAHALEPPNLQLYLQSPCTRNDAESEGGSSLVKFDTLVTPLSLSISTVLDSPPLRESSKGSIFEVIEKMDAEINEEESYFEGICKLDVEKTKKRKHDHCLILRICHPNCFQAHCKTVPLSGSRQNHRIITPISQPIVLDAVPFCRAEGPLV